MTDHGWVLEYVVVSRSEEACQGKEALGDCGCGCGCIRSKGGDRSLGWVGFVVGFGFKLVVALAARVPGLMALIKLEGG